MVGLPSKRGLQACAGGSVTGAVHPTSMSGIAKYLIIFAINFKHYNRCDHSVKFTKVIFTTLCILTFFFLFSHLESNDRISLCSIS